jgi:hypothetical protein
MLEKQPFMIVNEPPIHTNGDYHIYKYAREYFLHTYKNIIVAERCAPSKDVFSHLKGDTMPESDGRKYHDYERPLEAMQYGIKAAKKLKFIVQ